MIKPPVSGLADLSAESRIISAPWNRMIRGIGLGQFPIDYDHTIAEYLQNASAQLSAKVGPKSTYTVFCHALTTFVLSPDQPIGLLLETTRAVDNPYYRALAGSLVMETFAKLNLDCSALSDFPNEVLAGLEKISPDQIPDENQGRHGDYERLSACSNVFLAIGQIGRKDLLVTPDRNYIVEALNRLEHIPTPYFRGRSGSMFLSIVSLLGYDEYIFDGERDYMLETMEYLSQADELGIFPSFPNEIPQAWSKVYPILTMLNGLFSTK